jgi:hypothetical protein
MAAGWVATSRGALDSRAKTVTIVLGIAIFGLVRFSAFALWYPLTKVQTTVSR